LTIPEMPRHAFGTELAGIALYEGDQRRFVYIRVDGG
jgi:hypothetical protein